MANRFLLRSTHTLALCVLAALSVLFMAALVATPAAQAAIEHQFLTQITEVPASSGAKVTGPLGGVNALTVDAGELYVAGPTEPQNSSAVSTLDRFNDASGAFSSQFPAVPPPLEYLYQGVAVGHSGGEPTVYVGGDELVEGDRHGVVAVFNAAGGLKHVWKGLAATPGGFACFECNGGPGDVAVDNSGLGWAAGDVYVSDPLNGVVDVFAPETGTGEESVTQITGTAPGSPFIDPQGVAVSKASGDVLVVDAPANLPYVVDIFKPAALPHQYEYIGKLQDPPQGSLERFSRVRVDGGNGDIYLSERERNVVYQYNAEGAYLARITGTPSGPLAGPLGLAVDPETHRVYIGTEGTEAEPVGSVDVFGPAVVVPDVTTGSASNVQPVSALLNGTVNPDKAGEATCEFLWGTSEAFGHVAPCAAAVADGEAPVPVSATITGLQPDTTYYYRLQASNAQGTNQGEAAQNRQFTTTGPGLREAWSSAIAATSASLDARIDPNNAATSYYFQYGTTPAYGAEAPAAPGEGIGSGSGAVEVTKHIQGLLPQLLYHYRAVAVSELEVSPGVLQPFTQRGPDQTFTTQAGGAALTLPDGRAWEQVSPPNKHGSVLLPGEGYNVDQASQSGSAITYVGTTPTESGAPGFAEEEQIFSSRAPGGWSSQDISLPHRAASGPIIGQTKDFPFFSEDLSSSLADPYGYEFASLAPEVSPPDSERTLYLRHNDTCGTTPATCYEPLVTGAPGFANVPPGTKFGGDPADNRGSIEFQGATADLSKVILSSPVPLTSAPGDLYEWGEGRLTPVGTGGLAGTGPGGAGIGGARYSLSADGSRVVYNGSYQNLEGLLSRDTARGTTVQLDAAEPSCLVEPNSRCSGGGGYFQMASRDGTRVFFTDNHRLTSNSGANGPDEVGTEPARADLYECHIVEEAGVPRCELRDLTPDTSGERAAVLGMAIGASEDGAYVYFVANGALAHGATQGSCEATWGGGETHGSCNLYLSHDGSLTLVATLTGDDLPDWAGAGTGLGGLAARVSPDGRYLAFMSDRALTGYDNLDANSGKPDEEVYIYDATTGRASCASCDSTGARPVGNQDSEAQAYALSHESTFRANAWVAAYVPGWNRVALGAGQAHYQTRYLSDSGRLFFNSFDALVPQDVNNKQDVYEYEPRGIGSCATGSPIFNVNSGGCVGLISSGTAASESTFLDASENGSDVFFLTGEPLGSQDIDTSADVYDAHTCTSQAPCMSSLVSPLACGTADACRSAPAPQPAIFGSPPSATFSGLGNVMQQTAAAARQPKSLTRTQKLAHALKACRKKKSRGKRVICEHQARKRFAAKQSRHVKTTKKGNR